MRRKSDAYPDPNSDAYPDSYANTHAYAYSHSDSNLPITVLRCGRHKL